MTLKSYMGYTGQIGDFKAAESDSHKSNKFWGEVLYNVVMVTTIALAFTPLAPVGLAIGAVYAGAKAAYGFATGKDIFTGDKLSNEEKGWLALDSVMSVVSLGAGSKALSSTSKYAKFGNALRMTDNVSDAVQMAMLTSGAAYAAATGNWKDPSFIMAMGLAGLMSGRSATSKFGKGARKADMPDTPKIGNNINDTITPKHGKISSSDIDVKKPIDEVVVKPKNDTDISNKTNDIVKPKIESVELNKEKINNEYQEMETNDFSSSFAVHVVKGEFGIFKKGKSKIMGGHTEVRGLDSDIQVKLRLPENPVDDQVYRALLTTKKLDGNGNPIKDKPTTMFPKNWGPKKISEVAEKAFEQEKSANGITKTNFDQDVIVDGKKYTIIIQLTDLETAKIKSVYPEVTDPSWKEFSPLIKKT